MAKRLTDTDIWDKAWFMSLPPKLKCAVRFILDKCDLAGVWSPNWELAKIYIGDKISEAEVLNIDSGRQFAKLPSGKIFCRDFINFQNGKLNESSPIHIKIRQLLEFHNIPYPYPIEGVLNTPVVEVGVIVEERVIVGVDVEVGVKEKKSEKKTLEFPFDDSEFLNAWNTLIETKKWKKKSHTALQASLNKLKKECLQDAITMINNCIGGEWMGLVELKPHEKHGKPKQYAGGDRQERAQSIDNMEDIARKVLGGG